MALRKCYTADTMSIVGKRIAVARIEAGFDSAEEFAAALGVSGTTVRNWEKERHD